MTRRGTSTGCVLALVLGLVAGAGAQVGADGTYALEDGERNLKFAGIPVPGYSDVLGFNLGLVGMAYYKMDRHDDELPPSMTGLFGFYSENNSWIGAAFQKFHLDGDRWRTTAAFGTGSFKYQFNPSSAGPGLPDIFLDYSTATKFVFAQGSRRVWSDLFLGLGVLSWAAQVSVEPELAEFEEERYTGPGVVGEWDRRDHIMYPTEGYAVDGRFLVYTDALGSDREFQTLGLSLTGYRDVGDSTRVVAGRFMSETGYGDVPFSAQNILSGHRNLRGYSNGRHRGDQLMVVEAEYRWMFHRRWGAVVFGGLGWVADEVAHYSLDGTLPAAGLGVRFRIIETYRINARIDYGWGDHDQAVYFAIGEAY
jgi:hypothetical protein